MVVRDPGHGPQAGPRSWPVPFDDASRDFVGGGCSRNGNARAASAAARAVVAQSERSGPSWASISSSSGRERPCLPWTALLAADLHLGRAFDAADQPGAPAGLGQMAPHQETSSGLAASRSPDVTTRSPSEPGARQPTTASPGFHRGSVDSSTVPENSEPSASGALAGKVPARRRASTGLRPPARTATRTCPRPSARLGWSSMVMTSGVRTCGDGHPSCERHELSSVTYL